VTAAVLVNDRMLAGGKPGAAAWKSRDPEEMRRLTTLAEAAIGYDPARGDQISVENISFEDNDGHPAAGLGERVLKAVGQSEALLKYATILAAMLGLILFVIRPIAAKGQAHPALTASAAATGTAGGGEMALPTVTAEELVLEAQKKRAQSLHDGVVESIKSDPAMSARLLHSWIHAE